MSSNKPFLDICIEDIINKHGFDFTNTIFVLPNKRPILFIKKYLTQHITQACFLPKFFTIQEFFASQSTRSIAHRLHSIHILYTLYKKHTGSSESFEEFYSWGDMLLNDFDDIDKYCIPHKDLFANLSAIKEFTNTFDYLNEEQIQTISRFWNTTKKTDSESIQSKFLTIWQALEPIYTEFNTLLAAQNLAYEGAMYREIVSNAANTLQFHNNTKLFFIGFNALNTCETKLFDFFKTKKQAFFYWDYDQYYATKTHEAGYFITKNISKFGNELSAEYFNSFSLAKTISIVESPNPIAQVKQCKSIIEDEELDTSAIILADEQLLIPLLHAIPQTNSYNISLGYPIKQTQAFGIFEAITQLQQHYKSGSFYAKHLRTFCSHIYSNQCFSNSCNVILKRISTFNFSHISIASIDIDEACKQFIVKPAKTPYLQYLKQCITYLITHTQAHKIDKSIWYAIYSEIEILEKVLTDVAIETENIAFLNSIVLQSILSKSVPIAGEPLQGLQIMGILETRLLDFETITILSANEHVLPKKTPGSSFIPYSLRIAFGMPTIKEHNAIYAYYFYRILQRAKHITLLYSTQSDDQGTSEKSRYITQLLYELPHYNTNAIIHTNHIAYPIAPNKQRGVVCSKQSKEFVQYIELLKTGKKTISPTSLYRYIQCPLQFYYSEVLSLKKPEEIKELPDDRDYGNFFHIAMEDLYTPYLNKTIDKQIINEILINSKHVDEIVYTAIQKVLKHETTINDTTTIELQAKIIKKYIENMLEYDKMQAPFTIYGLETKINHTYTIANTIVPIKGIIDRINLQNNTISIIDYKTGKNKLDCKSIESIFEGTKESSNSAIFQICLYAYIIHLQNNTKNIVPHLMFIRDLHKTQKTLIYQKEIKKHVESYAEIQDVFEPLFNQTISSLVSPEIPFTQTEDSKQCEFCDFIMFCKK